MFKNNIHKVIEYLDIIYEEYYNKFSMPEIDKYNKIYLSDEFNELRKSDSELYLTKSYELMKDTDIAIKYADRLYPLFNILHYTKNMDDCLHKIINIIHNSDFDNVFTNINNYTSI